MRSLFAALIVCAVAIPVQARDDGRYANSQYKSWYESQHNAQGGFCCDRADGQDFYGDYQPTSDGGVEFDDSGKHYKLPAYMVLKGPNPTGHAVWWHINDTSYCFAFGSQG